MNRGMQQRWASTFCSTPWRTSRLCLAFRLGAGRLTPPVLRPKVSRFHGGSARSGDLRRTAFLLASLYLTLFVTGPAPAAPVSELWPLQPAPAAFSNQLVTTQNLPPALQPAVQFQKIFCAILAGTPAAAWRTDLEKIARPTATDPVSIGVSDAARTWLTRVWMDDLDTGLRNYYRQHVSFPDTLAALGKDWPESLHTDPWGDPWVYAPRAPVGFARQTNQRYQLGPTRNPRLSALRDAIQNRQPPVLTWKITPQEITGTLSLQFKSAAVNALIQPGGAVAGYNLLYIGTGWALLAGPDQLFTVTF